MTSEEIRALIKRIEKEYKIPPTELAQQGVPVDAVDSGRRVREDSTRRQMGKSKAELKTYEELDPHYSSIDEARAEIDNIHAKAKKISVNRTQFYDGRYRDYSSVEPSFTDEEHAKLKAAKNKIKDSHAQIDNIRSKISKIRGSIPNKAMGIAGDALFAERFINADAYDLEGGLYRSWDTVNMDGQAYTAQSVQNLMDQARANDMEYERNKEFNVEAAKLRELIRDNPGLAKEFIDRYTK